MNSFWILFTHRRRLCACVSAWVPHRFFFFVVALFDNFNYLGYKIWLKNKKEGKEDAKWKENVCPLHWYWIWATHGKIDATTNFQILIELGDDRFYHNLIIILIEPEKYYRFECHETINSSRVSHVPPDIYIKKNVKFTKHSNQTTNSNEMQTEWKNCKNENDSAFVLKWRMCWWSRRGSLLVAWPGRGLHNKRRLIEHETTAGYYPYKFSVFEFSSDSTKLEYWIDLPLCHFRLASFFILLFFFCYSGRKTGTHFHYTFNVFTCKTHSQTQSFFTFPFFFFFLFRFRSFISGRSVHSGFPFCCVRNCILLYTLSRYTTHPFHRD